MARLRFWSPSPRLWSLIFFIFCMTAAFSVAASSAASPLASTPSPAADVELICHTDNPAECYPKVFVPTDEFQRVHDDQDLPPGLHVRLNVWTGEKEAKINVPDEQNAGLEGLPVDSSVVVVEPSEEEITLPAGAPVYDPVGKIKEPPEGEESKAFYDSLEILQKGLDIDQALEELEDLSHDMYYGLKIAEDYETVKALFCLSNTDATSSSAEQPDRLRRARLAALTLSGALQNNAKALAEVEKHWVAFTGEKCRALAATVDGDDIAAATFRLVIPSSAADVAPPQDPAVVKARVSALKSLLKSDVIRRDFLSKGGMESLLEVLVPFTQPEWEPAREKVALLVQDIFLDDNMGATLGEWPVDDQLSDRECSDLPADSVVGRCWDYEARRLAHEHKSDGGHWSQELWSRLKEARKGVKAKQRWRDEL